MSSYKVIAAAITMCMISIEPFGQGLTIPDRVAAAPGKPLTILDVREDVRIHLDVLSTKADFIAQGKLVRLKSYLSDDRGTIFTDYQILPSRVIVNRVHATLPSPGQQRPLVLTVLGGETIVDGVKVTLIDSKRKPWPEGAEMLLFLKSMKRMNQFEPYEGNAGLFEVLNGQRVEPMLKHSETNPETSGVPLEGVISKISAAASRK